MITWQATRDVPLAELTRFPGNAHRGDVEAIRASVARVGQYRSIVVRDTGTALIILAGNHTADAMGADGHATARCEVITCTDDEAVRINLADNRLAALADDDPAAVLAMLNTLAGDIDGTGYTADELDHLQLVFGDLDDEWPPDDPPERSARPPREQGDVPAGSSPPAPPAGTTEIILVMPVAEGDRYADLIRRIRVRDGDVPAGRLVMAAMRAHAPAGEQ